MIAQPQPSASRPHRGRVALLRLLIGVTIAALVLMLLPALAAAQGLGNAWHIAEGAEPGIPTMRAPLRPATAASKVVVFSGNQFQGPGNPGNQTQSGSRLFFRSLRTQTWTSAAMTFHATSGNNKYYKATIPAAAFQAGDTVEYYLRITYSDHATTFLHGGDGASQVTASEAIAQATPFAYAIPWPAEPTGAAIVHRRGAIEARLAAASGHVSIVGPALGAAPGSSATTAVHLRPASARVDGRWLTVGRVQSSTAITDGLELRQDLGRRTVVAHLTMPADGVARYQIVDWGGTLPTETSVGGGSPTSEHFYGFGEKFNTFDQAGKRVRIVTADPPGEKGDRSYKVAPWFMSTRGYGFHLDSSAESTFDLRASAAGEWAVQHLFTTMRFELIYGPRLTDVLSRYTGRVGRAARPPEWVFGPWLSSDHWRDGGEVRYVVTKMIERGLPASVFVFDSPWETAYNDFSWNMTQFGRGGTYEGQQWAGFASVQDMMQFLRSHGLKVVVWLTPFVNVSSFDEGVPGQNLGKASIYDDGAARGHFVRSSPGGPPLLVDWWKGRGSPVDFTSPAARAWFTSKLSALVAESDGVISGFKIDDGEGDFVPLHAAYSDGRTGVEMRNGYTVEYHRAMNAILGDQGVLFSRSGFTGTSAFPACWAGDNEPNFGAGNGLQSVIVAGQSAAMSGYAFWAHDIGGYQDSNLTSTPANLFMRWTQFGALSPIMQLHRQVRLGLQYPWSYGAEALDNYRRYAKLHTALFPYLYTYATIAAETGVPIIRPLVLMQQDDVETHGVNHTYFLGDDLVVAPVISAMATERRLYLPRGTWYDFWTQERIEGGRLVTWRSADQSQVPLFVRAGAIVPMLPGAVQTLAPADYVRNPAITTPDGSLELRVYPASGTNRLRVHDGTEATVVGAGTRLDVTVTSVARALSLRVVGPAARAVTANGVALPRLADEAAFEAASWGWVTVAGATRIKRGHAGGTVVIAVEYDAAPFLRAARVDGVDGIDGVGDVGDVGDGPDLGEGGADDEPGAAMGDDAVGCAATTTGGTGGLVGIGAALAVIALAERRRRGRREAARVGPPRPR